MTRRVWFPTRRTFHAALLAAIALGACGEPSALGPSAADPIDPSLARGGGSGNPIVSATNPTWGNPGESHKLVRVLGSGFDATAAVIFERNGAADPAVTTHATRFISSTELEAEISISTGAALALYDVAVQLTVDGGPGKKGIALQIFAMTTGFGQASALWPNSMNDAGQVVAGGSVWQLGDGWEESVVDASATVWDIDEAGTLVVGTKGSAMVWTRSGSSWSAATTLPAYTGKGSGGIARGVATVAGTAFVVGHSNEPSGRSQTASRPALWRSSGGGWTRTDLPLLSGATSGLAHDVNPAGTIVGNAGGGVVWERDGSGAYQATALPGGANSPAFHINDAGTVIVGVTGDNVPVSWTKTGGTWGAATPLASNGTTGCGGQYAFGVNDQGWVVGRICFGNEWRAVLWRGPAAPYEELGGKGAMAVANADAFGIVRIAGQREAATPGKVEGIVWSLSVAP